MLKRCPITGLTGQVETHHIFGRKFKEYENPLNKTELIKIAHDIRHSKQPYKIQRMIFIYMLQYPAFHQFASARKDKHYTNFIIEEAAKGNLRKCAYCGHVSHKDTYACEVFSFGQCMNCQRKGGVEVWDGEERS